MNLKKLKIIAAISIFALCFLTHFGYTLMPGIITSFFFPVNESTFEHMKMIYTTIIIWTIIEYIIIKKQSLIVNNIFFNGFLTGFINIIIFLILYLPIRHILGEQMIITFILLFISIILTQVISYYLLKTKPLLNNKLAIILIIIGFIILATFTYKPLHNDLFYDAQEEIYGLPTKKDL